jgi:hypothetical protein
VLTFAIVASRNGRRLPDQLLDRLHDRTCPDVPFDAGSHLVWSNEQRTVSFGGWQDASDDESAAHHWHVDGNRLTAFTGHVWPRHDGWRGGDPWAQQLAEHLRSTPLTDGTDDLAGIYIAVSLHRRGGGSVAADPLGVGLVYWGQGREIAVISSRASLAASLLAAEDGTVPRRDAIGAGWLAYSIYGMGLQTGFERISLVPEGAVVDIDPAGGIRLLSPPRPPWYPPPEGTTSPEAMLEEARGEMTTAIRMALAAPEGTKCVGLTGGRDTRLILALLLADGLAGEFEFQTVGQADLPDVIVAKHLAESFGLRHVVNPGIGDRRAWQIARDAALREEGHADVTSREAALRIAAWAASGAQNVGQPQTGRPPRRDRVLLSGGGGEVLRKSYPGTTRLGSKQQAATLPSMLNFGTAGILRPEVLTHYQCEIHRLLFDGCLETDSPVDVADAFYVRNELRRWLGSALESDYENRVFPIYSITSVRLAFAIGAENRHAEWIHYQLMRQACEPLVHMPFANDDDWPTGAADALVPPLRYSEPAPAAPVETAAAKPVLPPAIPPVKTLERSLARDGRAQLEEVDLEVMRRFLRHDPANPVFEIIDPVATQRTLDNFGSLHERQRMQVYGALTAAIWLGGHEIALPREVSPRRGLSPH